MHDIHEYFDRRGVILKQFDRPGDGIVGRFRLFEVAVEHAFERATDARDGFGADNELLLVFADNEREVTILVEDNLVRHAIAMSRMEARAGTWWWHATCDVLTSSCLWMWFGRKRRNREKDHGTHFYTRFSLSAALQTGGCVPVDGNGSIASNS